MTFGPVPVRLATPPQFAEYAMANDKALHMRKYSASSGLSLLAVSVLFSLENWILIQKVTIILFSEVLLKQFYKYTFWAKWFMGMNIITSNQT